MEKQKKQLLIFILILAIIAAAYAGMKFYNKNHTEEEDTVTYPITQTEASAVKTFAFSNENGSFSFLKDGDNWYAEDDKTIAIDAGSLESMVENAVSLTSSDKIEGVEDLSQYGLDTPEIRVTYTTEDGSVTFKIGDYNSTISQYYIYVEGETSVYTIDSSTRDYFTKSLEDLKAV